MEDLPGLGVTFGDDVARLPAGKEGQHSPGQGGIEPQAFERGDDAVPAEGGAVPRNPGVRIRSVGGLRDHQAQVRAGAVQDGLELVVRGPEARPLDLRGAQLCLCGRAAR